MITNETTLSGIIRAYLRVSTSHQTTDNQKLALTNRYPNCEIIWYTEEGISGKSRDNRPALARLLAETNEGDLVVAVAVDRIARSLPDLLSIVEQVAAKHSILEIGGVRYVSNSPMDNLLLQILGALAQFELSLRRERQKAGYERIASTGAKLQTRPPHPKTALIRELLSDGKTASEILNLIDDVGKTTVYAIQRQMREDGSLPIKK